MASSNSTTDVTTTPTTTPGDTTTTTLPPTTSSSTTTLPPVTSETSIPPSTTTVPPASTLAPTTVVTQVTSIVTQSPSSAPGPVVTTITSTQPVVTFTPSAAEPSTLSQTSTSASSTRSALSASGTSGSSSGGLTSGATIAIAVIIPIVAVIAFLVLGIWFWRKRKARKNAQELRKNEMAEYGYNPNEDPTLPVAAVAAYTDNNSEGNDDSGYRGWGATTASNRKASTTLGSNSRAAGMNGVSGAMSDGGSQGGYAPQASPSAGAGSEGTQDPLMHGYPDANATGAVGAAAFAGGAASGSRSNRYSQVSAPSGIHRGPSNASSAYSTNIAHSEASSDVPDMPRPYYQEEVPYNIYNEAQPGQGQYNEGSYSGPNDQPIIRDVQARRNTRIERAPTFPQQGGISQNF